MVITTDKYIYWISNLCLCCSRYRLITTIFFPFALIVFFNFKVLQYYKQTRYVIRQKWADSHAKWEKLGSGNQDPGVNSIQFQQTFQQTFQRSFASTTVEHHVVAVVLAKFRLKSLMKVNWIQPQSCCVLLLCLCFPHSCVIDGSCAGPSIRPFFVFPSHTTQVNCQCRRGLGVVRPVLPSRVNQKS